MEVFADILSHDALVIYRLATELPGRMSKELYRLYRDPELPLMLVLDNMRRVGLGLDGDTCAGEVKRTEKEMAVLAQEISAARKLICDQTGRCFDSW